VDSNSLGALLCKVTSDQAAQILCATRDENGFAFD
jgi:hypothetical protein